MVAPSNIHRWNGIVCVVGVFDSGGTLHCRANNVNEGESNKLQLA